jgi:hypothetical protein
MSVVIVLLLQISLLGNIFAISYITTTIGYRTTTDTASSSTTTDSSPSFPNQEIIDPDLDWIDLKNRSYTKGGDRSTDIESVDYYSDGHTLNAILWLYFPFKINPPSSYKNINYGMYIDADFDETTGFGGIEYKVELGWNNQTKTWTKVLEKWSHFGDTVVLDNKTIPSYTNFSKKGAHYVLLSADLDAMLSPKKYKVIFYGEVNKGGSFKTDFTREVAIPPLELTVSTSPNSVELRKGEQKTIEVRINTTQGYEPTINLHTTSPSKHLIFDFTQNDTENIPTFTLRIPSYGVATIPLTISSSEDAPLGPSTVFIFANSSFPPEQFIKPKQVQTRTTSFLPPIESENIFRQSTLLVTLQEPLTLPDYIGDFWNKVGGPVVFVYGILAGISPWVFTKIKGRFNKKT